MSSHELRRVEVLARVKSKQLKVKEAAELMGVCYRQAKRLWKRYRKGGAKALKHANVGRRSNRAKPEKFRRQVLDSVRQKYSGPVGERFGPTLAAEHLAEEDGLPVDAGTLRRWMLAEGLWSRARKRKPYLQRRQRRPHFGELVQLDGSFHEWLEKRGPRACLMNMVDDATGTTLATFSGEETTWAAARILRAWIERYGVPRALYTDWKNVYKRKPTPKEELEGRVPVSQFGRMCARLGIEIIAAGSPQAKGRVERNHGTHQDRLVKKLRVKGICDYEKANEFLVAYLAEHNARFTQRAAEAADYHGRKPIAEQLARIFRLEYERTVSNDWVIRHQGRWLQLEGSRHAPAQCRVTVWEAEDGSLEIRYRDQKLAYQEIAGQPPKPKLEKTRRTVHRPPHQGPDHPWRKRYLDMKVRTADPAMPPRLLRVPSVASP
ncbi:MAG TPA: ISNCY family transposase [Candidatus Acidoferrum sp.]